MEPSSIHFAFCANDRYLPGLICAAASLIKSLSPGRHTTLHIMDAGLSPESRHTLETSVDHVEHVQIRWITPERERFEGLHSSNYHISACYRLLLPDLIDSNHVIYLDADTLIFKSPCEIHDAFASSNVSAAAVPDWEIHSLAEESQALADHACADAGGSYFNSGVLILDLKQARETGLSERLIECLRNLGQLARFADQSAINVSMHGQIDELEPTWNNPAWAFDQQQDNSLPNILHFTNSAPWLQRHFRPSQALFERVAMELGVPLPKPEKGLRRTVPAAITKWLLAPARVTWHGMRMFRALQRCDKRAADGEHHIMRHWLSYFTGGPARVLCYRRRIREIREPAFRIFPERNP